MTKTVSSHPDFSKIPKFLFWDTKFDEINWEEKYIAIINRVFDKGDENAKAEIKRFYGNIKIKEALQANLIKPMRLYINK